MGKTRSLARTRMPFFRQVDDMDCGIACLRMLEEWQLGGATRPKAWRERLGDSWNRGDGFRRPVEGNFEAAAKLIPGLRVERRDCPEELLAEQAVVLFIDSFSRKKRRVENPRHFLVVHEILACDRGDGKGVIRVAAYHDPWTRGGRDTLWPLVGLVSPEPHATWLITRVGREIGRVRYSLPEPAGVRGGFPAAQEEKGA